jgi:hypothetical protein
MHVPISNGGECAEVWVGFGLGAGKMRAWKRVTRIHGV